MFPWSPEFAWDAYHVAFFGALYSVLATVAGGLALAAWRARRDAREGRAGCDRVARRFRGDAGLGSSLPPSSPARPRAGPARAASTAGIAASTPVSRAATGWSRPPARTRPSTSASTCRSTASTTGGTPGCGRRPTALSRWASTTSRGAWSAREGRSARVRDRLEVNGPAGRLTTHGNDVRVLSPVEGTVLEVRGEGPSLTLRVDPGGTTDLRHLLSGSEARAWALRELERLQRAPGWSRSARRWPTAASSSRTSARRCPPSVTTRCSATCSWSHRTLPPRRRSMDCVSRALACVPDPGPRTARVRRIGSGGRRMSGQRTLQDSIETRCGTGTGSWRPSWRSAGGSPATLQLEEVLQAATDGVTRLRGVGDRGGLPRGTVLVLRAVGDHAPAPAPVPGRPAPRPASPTTRT